MHMIKCLARMRMSTSNSENDSYLYKNNETTFPKGTALM